MRKEFVSYEQALALKELGFDELCLATYNGETLDLQLQIPSDDYFTQAPLKQQVFRWFRDKHYKLQIIHPDWNGFRISIHSIHKLTEGKKFDLKGFNTYEEAEDACIDKLIEITK